MIILDGKEGGGQIVRTALALSSLTGQPFRIQNIRQSRPQQGLKQQHLQCIKALQTICGAKTDGDEIGSRELLYVPQKIKAKNITIDIGTAGSTTLLLQAIMLPCIFADKTHKLTITGGTDTKWSMPIDYLTEIVLPQYRRLAEIELKLHKRGYYPKGEGKIELTIKPEIKRNEFEFEDFLKILHHKSFTLTEQGNIAMIKGVSHASKDLEQRQVAERQANSAKQTLKQLNVPVEIRTEYSETKSTGSGITLWAIFSKKGEVNNENPVRIGADFLGEQGISSEEVGTNAAEKLIQEIKCNAPVDRHLADNIVPIMGLCRPSTIKVSEITEHTLTNIRTTEAFLGKIFKIQEKTITT